MVAESLLFPKIVALICIGMVFAIAHIIKARTNDPDIDSWIWGSAFIILLILVTFLDS